MVSNHQFQKANTVITTFGKRFNLGGSVKDVEVEILSEHEMDVFVNDTLTMTLVCTADHLTELVLGHLWMEGAIQNANDIRYLEISPCGRQAKVGLNRVERPAAGNPCVKTTQTSCAGNHVLDTHNAGTGAPPVLHGKDWDASWVWRCAERFALDTPLHKRTRSTHSCFLLHGGEIVFEVEDIGRHNAMDKALGFALLQGFPPQELALFTSGRIPVDMVAKAIRAGIPLLISKETATEQAIAMAERYHLTLIGRAHPESFVVYTKPTNG